MATVLVTGGTGFVGKVTLERLLHRTDIARVYILIRPKRGTKPQDRLEALRTNPCLSAVKDKFDGSLVMAVEGDMSKAGLGLSPDDSAMLTGSLTHIINIAASVKFDNPLGEESAANVDSALGVLALAERCTSLVTFVHCSTAYTPPPSKADPPLPEAQPAAFAGGKATAVYERILKGVTAAEEEEMLAETGHPNTYNYTKCLAEMLLTERRKHVPLVIVRPSIISSSWRYPSPGWIDSKDAFAAFVFMVGSGFSHTICADKSCPADLVPCDAVADRLLYAAFGADVDRKSAAVIHAVAGRENSLTIEHLMAIVLKFFKDRKHWTYGWPYVRVLAPAGDPRIAASVEKDVRSLKRMQRMARLVGQRKIATLLGRAAEGCEKIPSIFTPFTHNAFDFKAKMPLGEYMAGFDAAEWTLLAVHGIYFHLLGGQNTKLVHKPAEGPAPALDATPPAAPPAAASAHELTKIIEEGAEEEKAQGGAFSSALKVEKHRRATLARYGSNAMDSSRISTRAADSGRVDILDEFGQSFAQTKVSRRSTIVVGGVRKASTMPAIDNQEDDAAQSGGFWACCGKPKGAPKQVEVKPEKRV